MKSVSESRLLSLFGGQGLDWLQVEVVIQMEIVEVLTMDQQVEHVVTLPADLEANLDPVQASSLKMKRYCYNFSYQARKSKFIMWIRWQLFVPN